MEPLPQGAVNLTRRVATGRLQSLILELNAEQNKRASPERSRAGNRHDRTADVRRPAGFTIWTKLNEE
jgi:hypothetical protein